jgi:peroxiredoxin
MKRFVELTAIILIGLRLFSSPPASLRPHPLVQGDAVPQVRLVDLSGKPLTLHERVFLTFFSITCHWSEIELSALAEFARSRQDVQVVAVHFGNGSADEVQAYVQSHDMPYTVAFDIDGSVAQAFGVSVTPTSFVLEDGLVRFSRRGGGPGVDAEQFSLWVNYVP